MLLCPHQGKGTWIVADHHSDPSAQAAALDGLDDGLQVSPLPGTTNR